jgi:aldehyde:ferredoxin oxidoreductase
MGVSEEIIERLIKGLDGPEDEQEIKIGALLKYSHRWFTILGSLGLCARAQMNRFYNAELCAELYEAVTGIKTDLADLNRRAERVWTLLRQTNVLQGLDRTKDALPPRWFKESGFKNYVTGEPQQLEEAEAMIMDYYREWGWYAKTGVPRQSILEQLGLT